MTYTRDEIIKKIEDAAEDMSLFYKKDFINYRGKTTDTNEYYSEVIAEWLTEHIELLGEIRKITRQGSYRVEGHNGINENPHSCREEELIAMAMKRQGDLPIVGKVIDYQTPLKNERGDKAGKIDLLAYDGKKIRILELKEPDSRETMLRCVLEGYTYLKTVDAEKLLSDFSLPEDTEICACPFVFREKAQWEEMQQNRPYLKKIMEMIGIKPYYIQKVKEKYIVTEE